jgi:hypothetical protein
MNLQVEGVIAQTCAAACRFGASLKIQRSSSEHSIILTLIITTHDENVRRREYYGGTIPYQNSVTVQQPTPTSFYTVYKTRLHGGAWCA